MNPATQVKLINLAEAQDKVNEALSRAKAAIGKVPEWADLPKSTRITIKTPCWDPLPKNQAELLLRVVSEVAGLLSTESKKGGFELEGQKFPEATVDFVNTAVTKLEALAARGQIGDLLDYAKFAYNLEEAKAEDSSEAIKAPDLSTPTYQVSKGDLTQALVSTEGKLGNWNAGKVNFQKGKVRDNYSLDDRTFVSIATDRLSANNIPNLTHIPHKGAVLTSMSNFWLDKAKEIGKSFGIGTHLKPGSESTDPNVTIAHKVTPLPVEVVVRRYLTGTAYGRYKKAERDPSKTNIIFGDRKLAAGIKENQRLNAVLIDPTTKGKDDISVTDAQAAVLVGKDEWANIKQFTRRFFLEAEKIAAKAGVIIPDTKFEFGRTNDGKIVLIDEILTPDSSRFWFGGDGEGSYKYAFARGQTPPSFDKDPIRRWAREQTQAGTQEASLQGKVPEELVRSTAQNYIRIHDLITGKRFEPNQDMNAVDRIKANLTTTGFLRE